jgi:hypothetical protein
MQRIQDLHKSEDFPSPAKSKTTEPRKKSTPVKNRRSKHTEHNDQQIMDHDISVSTVGQPYTSQTPETKISQNKTKKLVNKYKQSQSSIVKRLGTFAVFSSRRKRNCRTENEDAMRKTQKRIKLASKSKMKIDTTGEMKSSVTQMETEKKQ